MANSSSMGTRANVFVVPHVLMTNLQSYTKRLDSERTYASNIEQLREDTMQHPVVSSKEVTCCRVKARRPRAATGAGGPRATQSSSSRFSEPSKAGAGKISRDMARRILCQYLKSKSEAKNSWRAVRKASFRTAADTICYQSAERIPNDDLLNYSLKATRSIYFKPTELRRLNSKFLPAWQKTSQEAEGF